MQHYNKQTKILSTGCPQRSLFILNVQPNYCEANYALDSIVWQCSVKFWIHTDEKWNCFFGSAEL